MGLLDGGIFRLVVVLGDEGVGNPSAVALTAEVFDMASTPLLR